MWADPADDPRNSEGVSPNGEWAALEEYLSSYRLTLLMKCEWLDPGQLAHRAVPPFAPGDRAPRLYGAGDTDFENAVGEQARVDGAFADLADSAWVFRSLCDLGHRWPDATVPQPSTRVYEITALSRAASPFLARGHFSTFDRYCA